MSLSKITQPAYTDVTISGNGTSAAPLGLNFNGITGLQPYNETLLYSGTTAVSAATLAESKSNFERLKIKVGSMPDSLYYQEYGVDTTAFHMHYAQGQGGAAYWRGVYGTWNGNTLTMQRSKRIRVAYTNNGVSGESYTTAGWPCIWAIWGVNRK